MPTPGHDPDKEPAQAPEHPPEVLDADDVIRDYYEGDTDAAFREDGTEPVSSVRDHGRDAPRSPELSGGDVDAARDPGDVGAETVGGSNPTPDQDIVDALGQAVGITYQDNEPLKFGERIAARDEQRWELNPASSEDYHTRTGDPDRSSSESAGSVPGASAEASSPEPKSHKPARSRKSRTRRPSP